MSRCPDQKINVRTDTSALIIPRVGEVACSTLRARPGNAPDVLDERLLRPPSISVSPLLIPGGLILWRGSLETGNLTAAQMPIGDLVLTPAQLAEPESALRFFSLDGQRQWTGIRL
jgi:hypothetical protein